MLKDTTLTLLLNVSGERPSRERKAGVLFPQPPLIFCATRTYNTHAPFHMAKQTTKVSVIRNVEEESNGLHSTIKMDDEAAAQRANMLQNSQDDTPIVSRKHSPCSIPCRNLCCMNSAPHNSPVMYCPSAITNMIYSTYAAGNILALFGLIALRGRFSVRNQVLIETALSATCTGLITPAYDYWPSSTLILKLIQGAAVAPTIPLIGHIIANWTPPAQVGLSVLLVVHGAILDVSNVIFCAMIRAEPATWFTSPVELHPSFPRSESSARTSPVLTVINRTGKEPYYASRSHQARGLHQVGQSASHHGSKTSSSSSSSMRASASSTTSSTIRSIYDERKKKGLMRDGKKKKLLEKKGTE
ncbi:hypothetical protein PRIPAC_94321 [Pristionchus pacificus]|uniref:Uncharacterized protein n=1 Tax=Pristionchus pacificus TaxID=54126 RepID=A0A2A6CDD1_PRIPA|nr:hypothetical protein PRIPAC_94321 [Pristionchus pacificus]|eukprot:PDM76212.1 hypothetical protein PRIPAC_39816 [Pristionchus pacificus]